jgi:hypothetical protein
LAQRPSPTQTDAHSKAVALAEAEEEQMTTEAEPVRKGITEESEDEEAINIAKRKAGVFEEAMEDVESKRRRGERHPVDSQGKKPPFR